MTASPVTFKSRRRATRNLPEPERLYRALVFTPVSDSNFRTAITQVDVETLERAIAATQSGEGYAGKAKLKVLTTKLNNLQGQGGKVAEAIPEPEKQELGNGELPTQEFTVTLNNGLAVAVKAESWGEDGEYGLEFHGAVSNTGYKSEPVYKTQPQNLPAIAKEIAQRLFDKELPKDVDRTPLFNGDRCTVVVGRHKGTIAEVDGQADDGKVYLGTDLGGFKPSRLRRFAQGEISLKILGESSVTESDGEGDSPTSVAPTAGPFKVGDRVKVIAVQSSQSNDWIGRFGKVEKVTRTRVHVRLEDATGKDGYATFTLPLPFDHVELAPVPEPAFKAGDYVICLDPVKGCDPHAVWSIGLIDDAGATMNLVGDEEAKTTAALDRLRLATTADLGSTDASQPDDLEQRIKQWLTQVKSGQQTNETELLAGLLNRAKKAEFAPIFRGMLESMGVPHTDADKVDLVLVTLLKQQQAQVGDLVAFTLPLYGEDRRVVGRVIPDEGRGSGHLQAVYKLELPPVEELAPIYHGSYPDSGLHSGICNLPKEYEVLGSLEPGFQTLPLRLLTIDPELQPRVAVDEEAIANYQELTQAGLMDWHRDPVTAFWDKETGTVWLASGFQRCEARRRLDLADVEVEIRAGNRDEALLFAVGANTQHGVPLSRADKRRAIALVCTNLTWQPVSSREIARMLTEKGLYTTNKTVDSVRESLVASGEIPQMQERKVKRGKQEYTITAPPAPTSRYTYEEVQAMYADLGTFATNGDKDMPYKFQCDSFMQRFKSLDEAAEKLEWVQQRIAEKGKTLAGVSCHTCRKRQPNADGETFTCEAFNRTHALDTDPGAMGCHGYDHQRWCDKPMPEEIKDIVARREAVTEPEPEVAAEDPTVINHGSDPRAFIRESDLNGIHVEPPASVGPDPRAFLQPREAAPDPMDVANQTVAELLKAHSAEIAIAAICQQMGANAAAKQCLSRCTTAELDAMREWILQELVERESA